MGFIDINTFKHRTGTVKVWYRDIPYTVLVQVIQRAPSDGID